VQQDSREAEEASYSVHALCERGKLIIHFSMAKYLWITYRQDPRSSEIIRTFLHLILWRKLEEFGRTLARKNWNTSRKSHIKILRDLEKSTNLSFKRSTSSELKIRSKRIIIN